MAATIASLALAGACIACQCAIIRSLDCTPEGGRR